MNKSIFIYSILLLFGWVNFAQNEPFSFINFTEKEGLNDKIIYDTTQDKQGFIWIGTSTGLYRFDGMQFRYFKSTADVPSHQISSILQKTYTDTDGILWLSSLNALQKYNPVTKKFSAFNYNNPEISQLIKYGINSFFRDSNGNLWITTKSNGWCLFEDKLNKTIFYPTKNSSEEANSKMVYKIIETSNGKLWALSFNGLFSFDATTTKVDSYYNTVNQKSQSNNFIDGFYDKKRNCIWIANYSNGISKFDLNSKTFVNYPVVNKEGVKDEVFTINFLEQKNDDEFWFSGGLLGLFNCDTNTMQLHSNKEPNEFNLKASSIQSFKSDKEGNLWIGSASGLSQLPWQNNQITNFSLTNPVKNFTIEPLGTVGLKNGNLLIANDSSNGVVYFDLKTKKVSIIEVPFYKNNSKITSGIFAIHKTNSGIIYAGEKMGLYRFDENKKELVFIPLEDQNHKKIGVIDDIISDANGNLYLFSFNNGFYFYDIKGKQIIHYNLWDIDKKVKSNKELNLVCPKYIDKANKVWFTLTNGVYCFDNQSRRYAHYAFGKAINSGAQIKQSLDIVQDKKGHYWIATADSGLFELVIEKGKEKLYNYTKTDTSGLPSDYCYRLVCDKKGFLWIGTLNGLVKFDVNSKKALSILTQQHGLKNTSVNVPINLLENGKLVINNYGGLSILDVNNYKKNTVIPKVELTAITVLEKEIDLTNEELYLKYNENFIGFHWAALSFNNSNQNRFAYKLVGIDRDWIYTHDTKISYSSLSHGDYVFCVKASNNDGVWSKEKKLAIIISPPFWNSWWFYCLLILLFLCVFYVFYRFKINQIKKEEKIKTHFSNQIAEIEMKALRAQMNPHFIFNSLNSIQKYILKNDSFEASQYLTKFSKLIRLILDHSNQSYILLSGELELLTLYVEIEALRFDNQFDYEIIVDDVLNVDNLQVPSMIIQPYIENAIWHGLLHKDEKGKLKVIITKFDEKNIRVIVEDNGVGRQKAEELKSKQVLKKKSYGLQITKDRIGLLNKTQSSKTTVEIIDLNDIEGDAIGTKVELIIPIQSINKT